jgi:hypothetical protein
MLPFLGRQIPVMQLKIVVFPAPFGPMIEKICPFSTFMETELRAVRPPKEIQRSFMDKNDMLQQVPKWLSAAFPQIYSECRK